MHRREAKDSLMVPLRIAVITSSFPRFRGDGVGSFIYSLTSSLVGLGHELVVLAPDDPEVVAGWQSEVAVERVRFVWPRSWSRLGHAHSLSGDVRMKWHAYPLAASFTLFAIARLWQAARRLDADLIHAQWLVPGGFVGAVTSRLTGIPLVVSLHGSDVFVAQRYGVLRPAVRFTLRTARHVIACSEDLARRAVALGLPPERVTVIPYGVDIERFRPRPAGQEEASEGLLSAMLTPGERGASPEQGDGRPARVIMAMGRLVYKKGFSYLLQAMPSVLKRCPDTILILAGEGDLRGELETTARDLGLERQVVFAGHIPWDQTDRYLPLADVLVVPSILDQAGNVDGLPNVVLEAMAAGCAIVASNVAGIPQVILDGRTGLLVPEQDPPALAAAICRLLEDEAMRRRLGEGARAAAVDSLSWQAIAERTAGVLQASAREAP
jgi:glycosyltransferase involved in cell wall biosynthesis